MIIGSKIIDIKEAINEVIRERQGQLDAYRTLLEGSSSTRRQILRGPELQLEQLKKIRSMTSLPLIHIRPFCSWLFNHIRDVHSLWPTGDSASRMLRAFLTNTSQASAELLSMCASRKIVYLHVSCSHLLHRARASVRSFRIPREDEIHVIVIGSTVRQCAPFIRFDSKKGVLRLHAPDNYECLHIKVIFAIAILESLCRPRLIVKCDDDVRMVDRDRLDSAIVEAGHQKIEYGGIINYVQDPKGFCRSWHIGKCSKRMLNRTGMQHFVPTRYADGGYSYMLGPKSIWEISNSFFYQRSVLDAMELGYEDVLIGLLLEQAGIQPTEIDLSGRREPLGKFAGLTVETPD